MSGGSTSPDIESCEDGIRILRGPGATEVTAAPDPDFIKKIKALPTRVQSGEEGFLNHNICIYKLHNYVIINT